MSDYLSQVYRDAYAAALAAGCPPNEAHRMGQDAVQEATR